MAEMTPERILALTSTASTVLIGLWAAFGKAKDSHIACLESDRTRAIEERDRTETRFKELEAKYDDQKQRIDKLELELEFFKIEHREFINFLQDIKGGSYDLTWINNRAGQLLARFNV